ncbi:uncharacterized protein LOC113294900 [Papaver somniferum]|uniref:uncharacterized protein LOC113294900 n=1 Tax=Papaver somniferum TaxID=3469 RepID=UPI000E6FD3FF|nr:uncharacterized protein LOC113294900 [Papaver somniferum]
MMTRRSLINIFSRSYSAVVRDSAELTKVIKSELKHEKNTLPYYLIKNELGSVGNFTLEWDKSESKDVVLRRKNEFGEEIDVSSRGAHTLPIPANPTLSANVLTVRNYGSILDGSEMGTVKKQQKMSDQVVDKALLTGMQRASGVESLLGPPIAEEEEEIHKKGLFPNTGLMKVCIKKPGLSSILQFDCGCIGKCEGGSEFSIQNAYYLPSSSSLGGSVYRGPLFSTLDPGLQDALKGYLRARGIVEDFTDFLLHHLHKREYVQYMEWLQKLDSSVRA